MLWISTIYEDTLQTTEVFSYLHVESSFKKFNKLSKLYSLHGVP